MKFISLFLSLLSLHGLLSAQTGNDNIQIVNQTETYEYFLKAGQVMVRQTTEKQYECTQMPATIEVYEMYDNESSIEKMKVKGIRGVTPEYKMYTSGGEFFYTDAQICTSKLYFDRKGRKAEVEIEKIYKNPRYFGPVYFPETEFIRRKEIRIIVPQWMKISIKEYHFDGHHIEKEIQTGDQGKAQVYLYRIENQAPIKAEQNTQGPSFIYPHVLVLTHSAQLDSGKQIFFETLDDQYKWYTAIVGQVQNDKALIKAKADEIAKGCATDQEKIKALMAWVQDNIRYIAFLDGIAGFKPNDAQEVLRKKYGDCKGMANLLKALLESQGYDSRLAWLGTNHIAYDYSTPSLMVDNHMICALFHEGRTYYLDATVKYMPLGEYPQTIQGRQVMIEDGDRFILDTIPVFSPQQNTDSLYCTYRIAEGALTGEGEWCFRGEAKQLLMSLIHSTPKDKLQGALKNFVERGNVQDKASGVTLKDAGSQSAAANISYKIKNSSGLSALGNEYYIDLNPDKDLMSNTIDTGKRVNDILLSYNRNIVKHIILEIPEGFQVSHLPGDFSLSASGYEFHISYERRERQIVYTCRLLLHDALIRKPDFENWNRDVGKLKQHYLDQIIFTKP